MDRDNIDSQTATVTDEKTGPWKKFKSVVQALSFIGFVVLLFAFVATLISKGFAVAWPGAVYAAVCLAISAAAAWPIKFPERDDRLDAAEALKAEKKKLPLPVGPRLPTKDSAGRYYGDRPIITPINEGIDLAAAGEWVAVELKLKSAEARISHFEPYDNSDVYLPGIWQSDIDAVRKYCAQIRGTESEQD